MHAISINVLKVTRRRTVAMSNKAKRRDLVEQATIRSTHLRSNVPIQSVLRKDGSTLVEFANGEFRVFCGTGAEGQRRYDRFMTWAPDRVASGAINAGGAPVPLRGWTNARLQRFLQDSTLETGNASGV